MSEPEDFLSRWARRKREAGQVPSNVPSDAPSDVPSDVPRNALSDAPTDAPAPASSTEDAAAGQQPRTAPQPTIDLSTLPPIESITTTTDIRGYLAPGIPAELTRAALRRAWVADPQIREFVGIAENQWDFTDPNGVPGFGTFGPLDDVGRLVARVIGMDDSVAETSDAADPREALHVTESPDSSRADLVADATVSETASAAIDAPGPATAPTPDEPPAAPHDERQESDSSDVPKRRGHGGALPK